MPSEPSDGIFSDSPIPMPSEPSDGIFKAQDRANGIFRRHN
ncbi:hypothetical protein [Neisseria gonorrhoeae]|nr:hypothetical protein [Neisseria gonorrhoeae]